MICLLNKINKLSTILKFAENFTEFTSKRGFHSTNDVSKKVYRDIIDRNIDYAVISLCP